MNAPNIIHAVSWLLAFACAGLIGMAAHRGGICMVRAVREPLQGKGFAMVGALVRTSAWTLLLAMPLVWWAPGDETFPAIPLHWLAFTGGVLFGIGAGINRACAISTATRLGNGEVFRFGTIGGFLLGAWIAMNAGTAFPALTPPDSTNSVMIRPGVIPVVIYVPLFAWGIYELVRIGRRHLQEKIKRERRTEPAGRRPFGLTALSMGIANGVLCARAGSWSYTNWLGDLAAALAGTTDRPPWIDPGPYLFATLLAGIIASALHRKTLNIQTGTASDWFSATFGGALMGVGAVSIPGGNAALILHAVPALSPHAVPAIIGMTAGIALVGMEKPRIGKRNLPGIFSRAKR